MTASSDALPIKTRRMSFEESLQEVPRHFGPDGDLVSSHVAACLSAVFPDGEDFFVRSVRHFRGDIVEPVLKREVGGFIGQEAIHGREHRAFNRRLSELGYPTLFLEKFTERLLAVADKVLSPKTCLAATAALEHYTATLAEQLLSDEDTRELFGDERDDYAAALEQHYAEGPPAGWQEDFISAYASAHPWEDFAETWAHYLHIVDTLETAEAFGLQIQITAGGDASPKMAIAFDPYRHADFDALIAAWMPLTSAVNSLNHSMGQPDLYPFVLAPGIVGKLRFIHGLIHGGDT